jgi:hypothetical protein
MFYQGGRGFAPREPRKLKGKTVGVWERGMLEKGDAGHRIRGQ